VTDMPRRTPVTPPSLTRLTYSIDETAAAMGLSSRSVYRLVWSGELRAVRSGRRVLVRLADIEDYLGALAVATR
jgi:excisionase family DNA binding protein